MKVFLEIPVLGYSVDKFSKRRIKGLSVISRPGGVNVEVGIFCQDRVPTYAQSALHFT
jgi:hypothetical protein